MQASQWKTSKHPPFSQHMSYHSVLPSPLEKDTFQGHRGPLAVLWVTSRCLCAHVCTCRLSYCCYQNLSFKYPGHAIRGSFNQRIVRAGTYPGAQLVQSHHCNQDKIVHWRLGSCSGAPHPRPASQDPKPLARLSHYFVTFLFLYLVNTYEFLHLGKQKALSKRGL